MNYVEVILYGMKWKQGIRIKIPAHRIKQVWPVPEDYEHTLYYGLNVEDNEHIKINHPTMIYTDGDGPYFSDIPFNDFGKPIREKTEWTYCSEKLPEELEVVLVQIDVSKIDVLGLTDEEIKDIRNDENHIYTGAIVDGFWEIHRMFEELIEKEEDNWAEFEEENDDIEIEAEWGIFNIKPPTNNKKSCDEYNQIVIKWQYLPVEEEEFIASNRFEILDL